MRTHRFHVSPNLPAALAPLAEITRDCWYSWQPEVNEVMARIDPEAWEASGRRPAAAFARLSVGAIAAAAQDEGLKAEIRRLADALTAERAKVASSGDGMLVAYFSCEFGLDQGLPIYSGGLGLLAGDHLKAATNLGVPLVGVGLFYGQGYFRQDISPDGWQIERYPENVPSELPLVLELAADGGPLTVHVDLVGERVLAQVWRAQVGSVRLYLLDTDIEQNSPAARSITDRLYGGDREQRIRQELVLGIAGVRALGALGLAPTVFHMNEGHSAFLVIERLRLLIREHGLTYEEAAAVTRASTVFTTHTPVPAGNEVFETDLALRYLGPLVAELGLDWATFAGLGVIPGASDTRLGMTVLALKTAGRANGVSALHGDVSRAMWQDIWPGLAPDEVPIGSVTNGVHTQSWLGPELRDAFRGHGLERVLSDPANPASWSGIADIDDETLWAARCAGRARLVEMVNVRSGARLAPDALTIGFSRRFASYKRAGLLLGEPERLLELLDDADRPLQLIVSGKAHPADDPGKAIMQEVIRFSRDPRVRGRIAFVSDYDIATAQVLVQGVDVWLNNPRRPQEASGTSGMKAALNGVLNLSILDGWWPEGYSSDLGWAIGTDAVLDDTATQDARDGQSLYTLLEGEVVPTFYERNGDRRPARWLEMMRASIRVLGPQFSAQRMVGEYLRDYYRPAHADAVAVTADNYALARAGAKRRLVLEAGWPDISVSASVEQTAGAHALGAGIAIDATITLGRIDPGEVVVEAVVGTPSGATLTGTATTTMAPLPGDPPGRYRAQVMPSRAGSYAVAVRVRPLPHPSVGAPNLAAIESGASTAT